MQDRAPGDRLTRLRTELKNLRLDGVWMRSTDAFLNAYVPLAESTAAFISGFTGSLCELLVTAERAYIYVDGRYFLQAESEVSASEFTVVKVPLGSSLEGAVADTLTQIERSLRIGYEEDRVSVAALERQVRAAPQVQWLPTGVPSLGERVRGPVEERTVALRVIDETKLDRSAADKFKDIAAAIAERADGIYVHTLDEIAWLTNLRGSDLPYQLTFRSAAVLFGGRLLLGLSAEAAASLPAGARPNIDVVPRADFAAALAMRIAKKRIAFDPLTTSAHAHQLIKDCGAQPIALPSPIAEQKAKKGPKELKAMVTAFAKADAVVGTAIEWLRTEVSKRAVVSEADFAAKVEDLFVESGAIGLSFKVISAAGRNGAVVHYSTPNNKRVIKQGELMLLDTGAYYEEGYASDLTRTFLVGPKAQKASREQKLYYTLVLKSAIAGMRARIPVGTRGDQLDAIVRAPLWQAGLNYNHGTGHGVGINVHEFPPRISVTGTAALEEGMVFSIEPGVYLAKFGGVRIENLCTLERIKGVPGFLQVRPLTFSPLDARLIERKLLSDEERSWLAQYMRGRAPK